MMFNKLNPISYLKSLSLARVRYENGFLRNQQSAVVLEYSTAFVIFPQATSDIPGILEAGIQSEPQK